MAVLHGLVAALTLLALACLPCLLALFVVADVALERAGRLMRRSVRRLVGRWQAHRLDRQTGLSRQIPAHRPAGPPIERVAADLRRLARARAGPANQSPVWFAAVLLAYDDRLRAACLALDVPQHLDELSGLDRDIERVRVEGALQAAGLVLVPAGNDRRQGKR